MQESPNNRNTRTNPAMFLGVGVGMGIALGAAVGFSIGNVGLGVALGIVIGAVLGTAVSLMKKSGGDERKSGLDWPLPPYLG